MKRKRIIVILVVIAFLLSFRVSFGDVPGSKDHPLLSRYPGSKIIFYEQKQFFEFFLLKAPKKIKNYTLKECKKFKTEGKVTKIIYGIPHGISAFEVFKNYEMALKRAGFNILANIRDKDIRSFIERDCGFPDINGFGSENKRNHFYLSAVNPEKTIFVSVYAGDGYQGRSGKAAVGIVEKKNIKIGLIAADNIKTTLDLKGHIALYGIYFDFNKSDIKPKSEPMIKEIAKFLKKNPKIKVYIVGHTDNIGKLGYNMELSKKRAEAVVSELTKKYGIKADRLKAFGVGPLCPVASNKTEQGRAKNRRVEIVKQ